MKSIDLLELRIFGIYVFIPELGFDPDMELILVLNSLLFEIFFELFFLVINLADILLKIFLYLSLYLLFLSGYFRQL